MAGELPRIQKIKKILWTLIALVCGLYFSQIFIYKYRFSAIDAELVRFERNSEKCVEESCSAAFTLFPKNRFLLIAHVLRHYELYDSEDRTQIFPISAIRGIATESWQGLRIYAVTPNKSYHLIATKPEATKLDYFMGILPRDSNHPGILTIPDIGPTISVITIIAGIGILSILLFATSLSPLKESQSFHGSNKLSTTVVGAFAAAAAALLGSGIIDSLIPEGDLRSRMMRTSVVIALSILPFEGIIGRKLRFSGFRSDLLTCATLILAVNFFWPILKAGLGWIITLFCLIPLFGAHLYRKKHKATSLILLLSLYDPMYMLGFHLPDIPPLYLTSIILITIYSAIAINLGSASVIALAANAYLHFARNVSLSKISSTLKAAGHADGESISHIIKSILGPVANLTGAGRASILINLPFTRPVIHTFYTQSDRIITFDDDRIPGAISVRAFVYGDEAWFETFSDFTARLGIPETNQIPGSQYLCISPIRVNHYIMGVLMLTSFQDEKIQRMIRSSEINEQIETIRLLINTISNSLAQIIIQQQDENLTTAKNLQSIIRKEFASSTSTLDFLQKYCRAVAQLTGFRTMLHRWEGELGSPVCQSGFQHDHWQIVANNPFNLSPNAQKAYGPTVVALREQKCSYLKKWTEIRDKLHPRTVDILDEVSTTSIYAIPLSSGEERFALTMLSPKSENPKLPTVMHIIEGTEAIFDASLTILKQKSSVLSLTSELKELDSRLELASSVQSNLLPSPRHGTIGNVSWACRYIPAEHLAGDWICVDDRDQIRTRFYLGDVTGKGPAAALAVSSIISIVKTMQTTNLAPACSISDFNRHLFKIFAGQASSSLCYAEIDEAGIATVVVCGMLGWIHIKPEKIAILRSINSFLGQREALPFEQVSVQLDVADTLICFSDGCLDGSRSLKKLIKTLDTTKNAPLEFDKLFDLINNLGKGSVLNDDKAMLAVRRVA